MHRATTRLLHAAFVSSPPSVATCTVSLATWAQPSWATVRITASSDGVVRDNATLLVPPSTVRIEGTASLALLEWYVTPSYAAECALGDVSALVNASRVADGDLCAWKLWGTPAALQSAVDESSVTPARGMGGNTLTLAYTLTDASTGAVWSTAWSVRVEQTQVGYALAVVGATPVMVVLGAARVVRLPLFELTTPVRASLADSLFDLEVSASTGLRVSVRRVVGLLSPAGEGEAVIVRSLSLAQLKTALDGIEVWAPSGSTAPLGVGANQVSVRINDSVATSSTLASAVVSVSVQGVARPVARVSSWPPLDGAAAASLLSQGGIPLALEVARDATTLALSIPSFVIEWQGSAAATRPFALVARAKRGELSIDAGATWSSADVTIASATLAHGATLAAAAGVGLHYRLPASIRSAIEPSALLLAREVHFEVVDVVAADVRLAVVEAVAVDVRVGEPSGVGAVTLASASPTVTSRAFVLPVPVVLSWSSASVVLPGSLPWNCTVSTASAGGLVRAGSGLGALLVASERIVIPAAPLTELARVLASLEWVARSGGEGGVCGVVDTVTVRVEREGGGGGLAEISVAVVGGVC